MCLHSCSAVRESLHESVLGVHLNLDKQPRVGIPESVRKTLVDGQDTNTLQN